jgi:hypothetical protein
MYTQNQLVPDLLQNCSQRPKYRKVRVIVGASE